MYNLRRDPIGSMDGALIAGLRDCALTGLETEGWKGRQPNSKQRHVDT